MAAGNEALRHFKNSNDPDHEQNDGKPVFGVAKAETSTDHCESSKPLQQGGEYRSAGSWPKSNRYEGEDGNGQDEQPCGPLEEDLDCHGGRFNPWPGFGNVSLVLLTLRA